MKKFCPLPMAVSHNMQDKRGKERRASRQTSCLWEENLGGVMGTGWDGVTLQNAGRRPEGTVKSHSC